MKYNRYGKFKFKYYIINWLVVIVLFVIVITNILYKAPFITIFIFLLLGIGKTVSVLLPYREKFYFDGKSITNVNGKKTNKIELPSQFVAVVSIADVCTPIAKKVSLGNRTYILKDKYAISILQENYVDNVLEQLHKKYVYRYTNCWIGYNLKDEFIYSFVFDQELLEDFLSDKECDIIIPESLCEKVKIDKHNIKVYVDKGY